MSIKQEEFMEVKNAVLPTNDQIKGFSEQSGDKPIYMVNLLKFREKAIYPDKRDTNLTGEEAYTIYTQEVEQHLLNVGGRPIFGGNIERLMLGEVEDLWDKVFIAMYPSREAMFQMISNPDYIKSAQHREAGLEGQLNIETSLNFLD